MVEFLRFKKSLKNIKAESDASNAESNVADDADMILNSKSAELKRNWTPWTVHYGSFLQNLDDLVKAVVSKDQLMKKATRFLGSIDTRNSSIDLQLEKAHALVNRFKTNQLKVTWIRDWEYRFF